MYIPRPAKRLFTVDDARNRDLGSNSDSATPQTRLFVECILAYGTASIGVRRYCTHSRFLCQSCKSKVCSSCGFKATEQWVSLQNHLLPDCNWQHITFTMPHLLWPFFNNNWPLFMPCLAPPPGPCSSGPANRAWRSAFSVRCILTVASLTSNRTFTCPSPTGAQYQT